MARIVVIEDDPPSRELMLYLLRAFGHEVREADDGTLGLREIQRDPPELVICDIQLPGLDGLSIARQIRADSRLSRLPLVAVTASAMVGDRNSVLAAGFDLYIAKPIVPEAFVEQVETALRSAAEKYTADPEPGTGAR
jgi:CheY-like chemotaxis protein